MFLLGACDGGDHVDQAPPSAASVDPSLRGPMVRWDLGARPLPEIPLPNDVATFPDRTSPTGVRLNASLVAPTAFESRLREGFDSLDGCCLLYTSPSPRDRTRSRMPSSA